MDVRKCGVGRVHAFRFNLVPPYLDDDSINDASGTVSLGLSLFKEP